MGLVFTPVLDAAPNTLITSASATVSGLTLGTKVIQIIGGVGQLSVSGRAWGTNDVVQNGDTVRLRVTTPNSELGEVTTVTVDVQSLGYIDWEVTNRNNMIAEVGSGEDTVGWFSVIPTAPISEVAEGFSELFDGGFLLVEEMGFGTDELSPALTTGATVLEYGAGTGSGFPAAEELVVEVGDGVDTLTGTLVIFGAEAGVGSDTLFPSLTASQMVQESASGRDSIVTAASDITVDEDGFGFDVLLDTARIVEDVYESRYVTQWEGADAVFESSTPTMLVEDSGSGWDELTPVNNVTINYDNVGFGFDEVLLSYPVHGAWTFNSRSMAMARWDTLQVLEVHEAKGVVYGLAADGLYVLSSTQAADARVESGLYDFGVIEEKRLRHVYATYVAETPLHFGVTRSNGGGKQQILYGKPAYTGESPNQTRIDLGRGPLARYWGVSVFNTDNGFASVKDMRLVPNVTSRRI